MRIIQSVRVECEDFKISDLHIESLLSHADDWVIKQPSRKETTNNDIIVPLLRNLFEHVDLYSAPYSTNYQRCLQRALVILQTAYGRCHIDIAGILIKLTFMDVFTNDVKPDAELLLHATSILESYDGQDYNRVVDLLLRLNRIYLFDIKYQLKHKFTLQAILFIEKRLHCGDTCLLYTSRCV